MPLIFRRKDLSLMFAIMSFLLLSGYTGCGVDSGTRQFKIAEAEDFSQMGWLDAYDALHALMQKQYAFGDWKRIDWDGLDNTIRPKIISAEAASDADDYATALLEYSRLIPDGHVTWNQPMLGIISDNVKGSYGLGIIEVENGKVIANVVTPGGPASNAGIDLGAEILEWNNVAITTAIERTSTLWRPNPASLATDENTLLEQYRAIVLDPVNTQSKIKYLKADGTGPFTSTLTAADDNNTILEKTQLWNAIDETDPITYDILPSGYGYILLGTLESEIFTTDTLYNKFKEAIQFLSNSNVPGIIIDLRGNGGGSDELAARISGFFYSTETVYEYQNQYNAYTEQFEIILPSADDSYIIGWLN